jgi:hypothetical protein
MQRWMTVMAIVVIWTTGGAALAQSGKNSRAAKGAVASKLAKADKADKSDLFAGTIDKLDLLNNTITILPQAAKGLSPAKPVLLTIDDSTVVKLDGKPATIDDLQQGMRVKASPSRGTADRIEASAAKAASFKLGKAGAGSAGGGGQ